MQLRQRDVVFVERAAQDLFDLPRQLQTRLALEICGLESFIDRGLDQKPRGLEGGLVELRL